MNKRDDAALTEIVRLCGVGANLVARGDEWYLGDPDNGAVWDTMIVDLPAISRFIQSLSAK